MALDAQVGQSSCGRYESEYTSRTSTWSTSRRSTSTSRSRPRRTTTSTSGARRRTPRRSSGHHRGRAFSTGNNFEELAPVTVDMIMHAIAPRPPSPERDAHGGLELLDEQQPNDRRMSPVCALRITISRVKVKAQVQLPLPAGEVCGPPPIQGRAHQNMPYHNTRVVGAGGRALKSPRGVGVRGVERVRGSERYVNR